MAEDVTFTITATMRERWAAQFIGLLKAMQTNGSVGHSEMLRFYSDGDGDFRPKFDIGGEGAKIEPAEPCDCGDSPMWDAG